MSFSKPLFFKVFSIFLCTVNILFFLILLTKIKALLEARILGVTIVRINKDEQVFDSTHYRYFYEPKPGMEMDVGKINRDTLNEAHGFEVQKSANTYRIITVGDSFTFGGDLPREKNYPETLERMLNQKNLCPGNDTIEVINLGVYGYDLNYSLERFKKRGMKYNPDLVIFLANDWNFSNHNDYVYSRMDKIPNKDKTQLQGAQEEALQIKIIDELKEIYGSDFFKKNAQSVIGEFSTLTRGRLLMITSISLPEEFKSIIRDFENEKDLFHLSGLSLPSVPLYIVSVSDPHPTELGYRFIAQQIYDFIAENGLIGCRTSFYK